jgi:DNA-binding response OmpR family regulator
MDGLAVLKRWRANGRHMPVLVLTARGSWAERVDGIDAGADDYLPKPFRMEELLARLRSIVRRSAGHRSSVMTAGDITLDERQMKVTRLVALEREQIATQGVVSRTRFTRRASHAR